MLVIYEVVLTLAVFASVILSSKLSERASKNIILSVIILYLLLISFRGNSYNLDTFYYSKYFDGYDVNVFKSWLIKLEPIHYVFRCVSPTFNSWLLIESALIAVCMYFLFIDRSKLFVVTVAGLALPLVSSSFRLSLAVLVVAVIYDRSRSWILTIVIGSLAHLAAAATILFRFRILVLAIVPALIIIPYVSPTLAERLGANFSYDGPVGLKIFIIAFIYTSIEAFYYKSISISEYVSRILFYIVLVILASTALFMLNRFLLVVFVLDALSGDKNTSDRNGIMASIFAAGLFFASTMAQWGPLMINLQNNADWQISVETMNSINDSARKSAQAEGGTEASAEVEDRATAKDDLEEESMFICRNIWR